MRGRHQRHYSDERQRASSRGWGKGSGPQRAKQRDASPRKTRAEAISGGPGGCFPEARSMSGGGGVGTHFNNLLLLFLLRLFAAPGLSLFLGGHCGERWHRPDLSAVGHRQGIWPRGRRKRTRASVAAATHGKRGTHSPQKRGLCDRSLPQSIVGSEERSPEAELRVRFCPGRPGGGAGGTWENDLASLVMSLVRLAL